MSNNQDLPAQLPDFWSRQRNRQAHKFEFVPFGMPSQITTNQVETLGAVQLSAQRFSQTAVRGQSRPISIRLVVRSQPAPPVPENLPEHLIYTGLDDWITISAGTWGHGFASLSRREAVIVLSAELAADVRLVSRYFIDHYLLNFILTDWAMLHASCVLSADRQRLIIMVAPHNTGKSTTALHLLRAGFYFLADGMALVRPSTDGGFEVGGYPIGEVKLRDDVLDQFPDYFGQPIQVREDRKTVVNLQQYHPTHIQEATLYPTTVQLCFVERGQQARTRAIPLDSDQVMSQIVTNTVFWDDPEKLRHNFTVLEKFIRTAKNYKLKLGSNRNSLITAIDSLP